MGVTIKNEKIVMTAATDNTSSAFGADAIIHANDVSVVSQATGGVVELKLSDSSGPVLAKFLMPVNDTVNNIFGRPLKLNNIYVSILPADVQVLVTLD